MMKFPPPCETLRPFPVKIVYNGEPRELADESTIADLLDLLKLTGKPVAVEVNLDLVPRERHASHQLRDGDQLEVVTLVGGG